MGRGLDNVMKLRDIISVYESKILDKPFHIKLIYLILFLVLLCIPTGFVILIVIYVYLSNKK